MSGLPPEINHLAYTTRDNGDFESHNNTLLIRGYRIFIHFGNSEINNSSTILSHLLRLSHLTIYLDS